VEFYVIFQVDGTDPLRVIFRHEDVEQLLGEKRWCDHRAAILGSAEITGAEIIDRECEPADQMVVQLQGERPEDFSLLDIFEDVPLHFFS
jgi:hypothetical protein